MSDLLALADRVEGLTGLDREVDALIAVAADKLPQGATVSVGGVMYNFVAVDGERCVGFMRRYTESIDAAMTLVPEGMILRQYMATRYVPHQCAVGIDYAHGGWGGHSDHSFALALCAAALRARAASGTEARRAETGTGSVHDGPVRDSADAQTPKPLPLKGSLTMTSKAMSEDGWIEWNGGECPVDPETKVQIRFRCWDDGLPINSLRKNPPIPAREARWNHRGSNSDIIAYRIVESTHE